MLYKIRNTKLEKIPQLKILESQVRDLISANLEELMGLKFVSSEFSVIDKRIDILAFDNELNAPVIIELKRDNDKGLFDQGLEYFNILDDRKTDFLIKLHEVLKIPADPKNIEWENSRVVFIGRNFTETQKRAVNFKGIPIELWDYDWHENDLFKLEQINLDKRAHLEIAGVGNDSKKIKKIKEFKEFNRDDHKEKINSELWEIFEDIESTLLSWEGVEEKFNKTYIGFWVKTRTNRVLFCDFGFLRNSIDVTFGKKLDGDNFISENIRYFGNTGHYGNGDFGMKIFNNQNLQELLAILEKIYKRISKE